MSGKEAQIYLLRSRGELRVAKVYKAAQDRVDSIYGADALCGRLHGDMSEFNVLMTQEGPVIIDLPQAVNAAGNQSARQLLLRDVDNLHRFIACFGRC